MHKYTLLLIVTLVNPFPASAGTVVEDMVDLISDAATFGLHSRFQEMNEAQLEAELNRRLSEKLYGIASAAKKARGEELNAQIAETEVVISKVRQLLDKTNNAILLNSELDQALTEKLTGAFNLSRQHRSVVNHLALQRNSVEMLGNLYQSALRAVRSQSTLNEAVALEFVAAVEKSAFELELSATEFQRVAVFLESEESARALRKKVKRSHFYLRAFASATKARLRTLEATKSVKKKALEKLLSDNA